MNRSKTMKPILLCDLIFVFISRSPARKLFLPRVLVVIRYELLRIDGTRNHNWKISLCNLCVPCGSVVNINSLLIEKSQGPEIFHPLMWFFLSISPQSHKAHKVSQRTSSINFMTFVKLRALGDIVAIDIPRGHEAILLDTTDWLKAYLRFLNLVNTGNLWCRQNRFVHPYFIHRSNIKSTPV